MPIITINQLFTAIIYLGGAVLDAVLADGKYTPRAISRSVDSAGSKALIAKGVEVVKGNLWDKESLKEAIRGSEAVFGNTNFWDPEIFPADPQGKGEITQGKNLVDAAKEVGVKFFIYRCVISVPDARKESNGLYTMVITAYVRSTDKIAIEEYLKASGVPYAVLRTAWFAENLWKFGSLQKTDTGYTIPIPRYGPNDIHTSTWIGNAFGPAAVALLKNYTDPTRGVLGSVYPVISMRFTYPQFAAAIAKAIGKEVTFTPLETSGLMEADEMFLFQAKFGMYIDTPVPNPALVALGVKFGSMEEFIKTEVVPRFA
ncbi:NAD(P)-binding protein [Mycena epipterygia]|nr:NAD(P)-binding protein [Mycena epipterygia]